MNSFDIFTIGDIATDVYIKIPDDEAHTYANEDGTFLALPFGAKVPYEEAEVKEAGGNAGNASVSFARLGLKSGIISNVGHDMYGRDIIMALHKNGVDTRYIFINEGKKTNYNYILRYKVERTILVHHEHYEHNFPRIHASDVPKWVYFSSLGKNSLPFHDDLIDWLAENPEVKLVFQPGTFQLEEGTARLKKLYQQTEILLLNRQEAAVLCDTDDKDVHKLLDKLHDLGPKIVVITDGPKGSYASGAEGRFFMPTFPDPGPPVERTGAGDAFSSAFTAAIIKGRTLQEALRWGPINSMNVVQHIGPQDGLLTETQLESYLRKAPDWYHSSNF